ncbi:MAG: methylthioribulose 1-phosphate dehydratase [Coleofasciculus sp. Co-bin14]|nr:methylthioribulose 1-phosphate dehydratase [Coleofasciculus sp. Co-bin14]
MKTDPRPTLITAAGHFYQLGWMVGTAGNLSARLSDGSFWITASGRNKGQLTTGDFIRIAPDGTVLEKPSPDVRPSAETSIHQAIYSLFPDAQACYHVHSIEANLVSNFTDGNTLPLPPLEMLKGLGVWEENPNVAIPLFANYLDVPRIASDIYERFKVAPPPVSVLLIRNHGVTVWASSLESSRIYLEVAVFIFRYVVAARNAVIVERFKQKQ